MIGNQKIIKYIFLDTNVFYHCKFFTEIDWNSLFQEKVDKIIIKVPFMVLKEIDEGKYKINRARQVLSSFKIFENREFKEGIELQLTFKSPKWDFLETDLLEFLDKNENDHHIIVEILNFSKDHPKDDILFITGDFIPSKISLQKGINTIFWLDEKYAEIFQIPKGIKKKKPELEIFLMHNNITNKKVEISVKIPPPEQIKTEEPIDLPSDSASNDILTRVFRGDKSEERYQKEVANYNEEILNFYRYRKITFILINNGNVPYTNIDIYIKTTLEKEFNIEYKTLLKKPTIPTRDGSPLFDYSDPLIWFDKSIPNVRYYEIQKDEYEKNNEFSIGYNIQKIKHGEIIKLYSILIWISENPRTDKIIFDCEFTQDQPGKIKKQILCIQLKK